MERIDKIIARQGKYSRSEVKKLILQKRVLVNGEIISRPEIKINEEDIIQIDGDTINKQKEVYIILNKPKGYVSATEDKRFPTVLELVPENLFVKNLFPAGRLDKDTTGLMIITNDGNLAHNILSPKKHIHKSYDVTLDIPVTGEMVEKFAQGIELNDGKCKPGLLEITGEYTCRVTITEGRYHQIKRMFGCMKAKVLELHRVRMGNLYLPDNLKEGKARELTRRRVNVASRKINLRFFRFIFY